jgi:uncharacterized protein
MAADDVDRVRSVYAAMARWDADALADAVAHDIEWTMPEALPWGGTHHGHDGVRTMAELFTDHVDGAWSDPDDFLDAGDRVVVLGRARGRARQTDREFEVGFAHVWGLTDGVPSSFRAYLDPSEILAALGGTS